MKLTDFSIRALQAPETGSRIVYDDILPGFGVRITETGTKSYVLTHGRRRQRETLGRVGIISLAEARHEAKRKCAEYTLFKHRPRTVSWKTAQTEFLTVKQSNLRPRTYQAYKHCLNLFKFGDSKVMDITECDLQKVLDRYTRKAAMQHHIFAVLRAFFRWAYRKGYIDRNPVDRMNPTKPRPSRSRVLTPDELTKLLKLALSATTPYHAIVALLATTGQRRSEIAALEWSWLDCDRKLITIPAAIAKNREEHCFPIGDLAVGVLRSCVNETPYVFPAARNRTRERPAMTFNGWAKPKRRFDAELQIAPYVLHDLRRTLRTNWAELGVSEEVAEKYINHVSGSHSGLARVYNRAKYLQPMRRAVDLWEAHLRTLIANSAQS